jgi:beta-glucosidase
MSFTNRGRMISSAIAVAMAGCAVEEVAETAAVHEAVVAASTPARGDSCGRIAPVPRYADWPRIPSRIWKRWQDELWIRRVVAAMTLEQKVGQMTQGEIDSLWDAEAGRYELADVTSFALGSVLNGGGSWPARDKHAAVGDWVALADAIWDASPVVTVRSGGRVERVKIPTFWGIDAVHGNNNVYGATVFPHNIGLGAARNTCLARDIGDATRRAVRATGQDWTFAPCLAVVQDDRWGRTYEGWSEDPAIVRAYAAATTEGMMGTSGVLASTSFDGIISTAKHYIADGGSLAGIDQGVVTASERELMNLHAQGYYGALGAGAQTVMVGFFSWHPDGPPGPDEPPAKQAGNRHLVTEVLKQKMGFDGLVVSDWNAIGQIDGCEDDDCPQAVNAGIDLFMVPQAWRDFIPNTVAAVRRGDIPMARIDDAVTRILRVKLRAGLFELPRPSERELAGDPDNLVDRRLARQAVRESLVLLKNDGNVLPLRRNQRVLVVGASADSIQNQTGGWTLSWQGGPNIWGPDATNPNSDFPNGQSILGGIRETVGASRVTYSADGSGVDVAAFDVVIAVIGEAPYAEFLGDIATEIGNHNSTDLALRTLEHGVRYPADRAVLDAVHGHGVPVVTVLLSGRPLYVSAELNRSDAFVAAWLPGTEGGGVADVLFRSRSGAVNHDFRGRLSFSWPRSACQTDVNVGDRDYRPLFPYGYGLDYRTRQRVGVVDETPGPATGCPD